MRGLKWLIWLLPFFMGLSACGSDNDNDDDNGNTPEEGNIHVVTGTPEEVNLTSATLGGTIIASKSSYTEIGIAYCLENSGDDMNYSAVTDTPKGSGQHSFSVTIEGLLPDMSYTYRAYVKDANGNLINANEQMVFHTKSPEEMSKYTNIQWVATNDATLCWDMTDEELFNELSSDKYRLSLGVAWSIDIDDLKPMGTQFAANTQEVPINSGEKTLTKLFNLKSSTKYYYTTYAILNGKLYVAPESSFTTLEESETHGTVPSGVQIVDLGLPSGTKWANMNVGAEKANDYGLFYAWGETVGHNADGSDYHVFDWASYKWCKGSRNSQTKYCTNGGYGTVDNKAVLELTDDAAFVNWGSEWRMPSNEEMHELVDNTTSEWTTIEGVGGYKLTSLITGNSIFFPAAGCRVSESHYEDGTDCYYWTASIDTNSPYASRYLRFYVGRVFIASMFRYYGMNVRPVRR